MITIMSADLVDRLLKLPGRDQSIGAGRRLFRTGDPVLSLFIVISGELQLVRALPHGAALTLQRARAGTPLAEASLFAECYHCDAVAGQKAVVRSIPLRRVKIAFRQDVALASAFMCHLAHEVQRSRTQAEILSLKTVAERLNAWIILNGGMPEKGRWREVAAEIDVTPEALYRELAHRRSPTRKLARRPA
jgi:CRP/FNR family transcriptional regulator, dissimilatory nitrate respiration regulator